MARATVYKGSSSIVPPESTANEVVPLNPGIKAEPTSPSMLHPEETDTPDLLYELEAIESNASSQRAVDSHQPMEIDATETPESSVTSTSKQQGSDIIDNKELSRTRRNRRASANDSMINIQQLARLRCRSSLAERSMAFDCDTCFRSFKREQHLLKHKTYYDPNIIKCNLCGKNFLTSIQITLHRKKAHSNINWHNKAFKCDVCNFMFNKKTSLQSHIFHFHDNKPEPTVRRRSRDVKNELISSELPQFESARAARKRKRDQLIEDRKEFNNLPTNSTAPSQVSSKPDKSAKSLEDKSCNRRSQNRDRPLVKIHAIPHEVEALLSDYDESAVKRRKIEYAGDVSVENVRDRRLRSGRLRNESIPGVGGPPEITTELRKNDAEEMPQVKKPDVQLKSPSILQNPVRLVTRKWALLKMQYNCRECWVSLEKIDANQRKNVDSLDDSSGAIDVQLRNLEIALKKLDVPDQEASTSKGKREIYRSSICRTRFTKRQRLINHYLCFHTNLSQDECGVCRMRCGNQKKLRNHLILHCIKIPKSKQDRSPIDPKGPCEKYKKKNTCVGCKKRFWLLSCLRKHEEFCRFIQRPETPQQEEPDNEQVEDIELPVLVIGGNKSSETDNNVRDTAQAESASVRSVAANVQLNEKDTDQKFTFQPLKNRSWEVRISRGLQSHLCTICNANFGSEAAFADHLNRYIPRGTSRCIYCGTLFPSRQLQLNHYKSAHTAESMHFKVHCSVCYQGFTSKTYLRSHILHIHWEQHMTGNESEWLPIDPKYKMKCKVCNLLFTSRKNFIEHAMYYYDDEHYNCSLCNKSFIGKFRCHSHWKTVHYTKEIQKSYTHYCKICEEGFMYKLHLYSHLVHVHRQSEDIIEDNLKAKTHFVCEGCEDPFLTPGQLSKHQSIHSYDGKYICNKCNRKCNSISILSNHHKASHTDVANYENTKCPICSEGMISKVLWMSHIKHAHENPENQPPEMCLERICTINQLISSKNIEKPREPVIQPTSTSSTSADVPVYEDDDVISISEELLNIEYTCAICDEKFVSMELLKNHKSIHDPSNYGCQDNTVDIQEDERSRDSVIVCETNQLPNLQPYKRIPLVNGVESQPISLVSPQQNPENCTILPITYPDKDIPCNLSIASIYSVGLEEYEKIANNQAVQENQSTEPKDINENPENDLRCDICNIVFTCTKTLKNHKIRYSNTGDYICEICGRRFQWMKAYKRHVTKHRRKKYGTPLWYCEACDEAFAMKNSKIMHFAHIHNEQLASDDSSNNMRISVESTLDSSNDLNVTSSSQDKSSDKEVYIEEVDLTEDESMEPANSQYVKTISTNSVAVKPTIIQQNHVQLSNYHSMDVVPNLCPIFCNICHVQCISIEFLVKHIENAHGIRLPGYKANCQIETSVNSTYVQQNITTQSSYQSNQDVMRNAAHKIDRIETQSSSNYYCKTCRVPFPSEYSLILHLRNAHDNNDTGNKTNLNEENTTRSEVQMIEKTQIDGTTRETSFLNSEKKNLSKDSLKNERAMDLTKKKDNIVLKRIHLAGDSNNAYRIIESKDTHGNVQIISIKKNELLNFRKLQNVSEIPESSNLR